MKISLLNNLEFHPPSIFNIEGAATVVFYFLVYSFIGWLLENSYSYCTTREFFKDNFLWGPFKPMYGIAPVLLVYLISPETNWAIVILLCIFIPTLVEYVSGALLQKLFHRQWWDYSDRSMQLHGHICLPFSVCWIFLSLICIKWIHPLVASTYRSIEPYWSLVWFAVVLYLIADITFAIRRHSLHDFSTTRPTNPIQ